MRQSTTNSIATDGQLFRTALQWTITFAVVLWIIKIIEVTFDLNFSHFGVYPGTFEGLAGILFDPLIHDSWSHLASNTMPLIVFGTALLYGYPKAAKLTLPILYLGPEIGVWLFARHSFHFGASGLTFGMMFFVFTLGAIRWDRQAIALSMLVFFLYGGMIWGIFPNDPDISFETHFFAAALGLLLAIMCKNRDPHAPEKHYSWEDEEDHESSLNAGGDGGDTRGHF